MKIKFVLVVIFIFCAIGFAQRRFSVLTHHFIAVGGKIDCVNYYIKGDSTYVVFPAAFKIDSLNSRGKLYFMRKVENPDTVWQDLD